jgi:pyruvate dehydrogenase E2 component (dihydrolipoamide acetyltransferase)
VSDAVPVAASLDLVMPRLSDSMEEGKILAWLKQSGDSVAPGDELAEIETDKATVVYEAEEKGVLEVVVPEGTTASVGTVIARLHADGHNAAAEPATTAAATRPAATEPLSIPRATAEEAPVPLSSTQALIARRMADSHVTVPDFSLEIEVDMTSVLALRQGLKQSLDPVPSINDIIVKACALALAGFPLANGSFSGEAFELHPRVNVGVAVATENSLFVPTVFDADQRSLGEVAAAIRELAAKVRDGTVTPVELSGATFTVSNLGMYGVRSFTAIISPPQAAILAAGAVERRPVVRNDAVEIRHVMAATLACDHRILYGAYAAKFLARIRDILEQAEATLA